LKGADLSVKKKKREKDTKNNNLKKNIVGALELPKAVALNLPLVSLVGHEELNVENYKGIIEYTDERIRLKTTAGILKVEGRKMLLGQITSESVCVTGTILKVEFMV